MKTSDGSDYEKYLSCDLWYRTVWKRIPDDHSVISEWYWDMYTECSERQWRFMALYLLGNYTYWERKTDWLDGKWEMCIVRSNVLKINESYSLHLTSVLWITQPVTLHSTLLNSYSTCYSIKKSNFSRMSVSTNSDYLPTLLGPGVA